MSQINYEHLKYYCSNPEEEILNIRKSFEEHLSLAGSETYRPKAMFYNRVGSKNFAVSSRKYVDVPDLYCSISEMLYSFSAFSAFSVILVLDTSLPDDSGALVIYVVSDDSACCFKLHYKHSKDHSLEWLHNKDSYEEITLKNNGNDSFKTNKIIEILFVYTHMDESPFTESEILSYYSMKGYHFRSFRDKKISYIDYALKT